MALRSVKRNRERILNAGGAGAGKTQFLLSIANRSLQTKSDAKFFCMDSDGNSIDKMVEEAYGELPNLEIRPAIEWDDYKENLADFQAKTQPDDWIVIDMIGPAWDAVQEWYVQQIWGKDMDVFFMEARKAQKKGDSLEGWKDYTNINKVYNKFMNDLVFKTNCHVYCATGVQPISDNDDKVTRLYYGPFGVRPRGQKDLAHRFHSQFIAACKKPGEEYILTSVKDRGRTEFVAEPLKDASLDYLVKKAGWKL